jgi:hypothetical protein
MSFFIQNLNSLQCPITQEIFIEPVIGSDCHTYERTAIIDWLQKKGISPITYEAMSINSLRSNLAIKNLIEELFQFDEINRDIQPPPIPPRQPSKSIKFSEKKNLIDYSFVEIIPSTDNNQLNKYAWIIYKKILSSIFFQYNK